jgi:hypothetical protein
LERSGRARIQFQTIMEEHQKQPGDIERVLTAAKDLGDARTDVGNARLRLHLMGATESIALSEKEFRQLYSETKELPELIGLCTLEEAEEEFEQAQVRYYESEMQVRTMEEMVKKGRSDAGNLLAACKEKFEAEAAYKFAGLQLTWLQPPLENSSYDPTDNWPVN